MSEKHGDDPYMVAAVEAMISTMEDAMIELDLCRHCFTMTIILNLVQRAVKADEMDIDELDIVKEIVTDILSEKAPTEQRTFH